MQVKLPAYAGPDRRDLGVAIDAPFVRCKCLCEKELNTNSYTFKLCAYLTMLICALSLLSGCNQSYTAGPFNGNDLDNWELKAPKEKSKWLVGTASVAPENSKLLVVQPGRGEMINQTPKHDGSVDIYSKEKYGDCRIELELMVPKESNSGIYVMGEYEVQVLDSFGHQKLGSGDMGAVYGAAPPPVNACKRPGQWQKYVIEFQAPRFDASGNKVANARFIKIELNGQMLHENLEMPGPTPGGVSGKEAATGPIMFQGNHGPVAYRNIRIRPLSKTK